RLVSVFWRNRDVSQRPLGMSDLSVALLISFRETGMCRNLPRSGLLSCSAAELIPESAYCRAVCVLWVWTCPTVRVLDHCENQNIEVRKIRPRMREVMRAEPSLRFATSNQRS